MARLRESFLAIRGLRIGILLCLALLESGCALFRGSGPQAIYTLTLPSSETKTSVKTRPASSPQLVIMPPAALDALDSSKIAVFVRGRSVQYLPGSVWVDTVPALIQAQLMDSFERQARFVVVGIPGEGLTADYQLSLQIRSFQIEVGPTGKFAQLNFFVKLIDARTGRVIATGAFLRSEPSSADSADAVTAVVTLDRASSAVFSEIVSWSEKILKAHSAQKSAALREQEKQQEQRETEEEESE